MVCRRDLFDYCPTFRAKDMPGASLNQNHLSRFVGLHPAVQADPGIAVQNVEGLFFLFVILFRMLLTGQEDNQFLAILAVYHGHHREPELFKPIDPIVVRNLQVHSRRKGHTACPQELLNPLYYVVYAFPHIFPAGV